VEYEDMKRIAMKKAAIELTYIIALIGSVIGLSFLIVSHPLVAGIGGVILVLSGIYYVLYADELRKLKKKG
jgi:hypothetical protein